MQTAIDDDANIVTAEIAYNGSHAKLKCEHCGTDVMFVPGSYLSKDRSQENCGYFVPIVSGTHHIDCPNRAPHEMGRRNFFDGVSDASREAALDFLASKRR